MKMTRTAMATIAAAIAANAQDEMSAQHGYIELAELMEELGAPAEHVGKIREIAGDERNHIITELALLAYYDPDTKIASDDIMGALDTLKKQLDTDPS
ncbi:MAG: hypothetical protein FWG38_02285 [Defluviitaleaceae bacterium]|jgi:hypothetical protein|nr:hypothetical protein [Defluviitaleaceae bacterium]